MKLLFSIFSIALIFPVVAKSQVCESNIGISLYNGTAPSAVDMIPYNSGWILAATINGIKNGKLSNTANLYTLDTCGKVVKSVTNLMHCDSNGNCLNNVKLIQINRDSVLVCWYGGRLKTYYASSNLEKGLAFEDTSFRENIVKLLYTKDNKLILVADSAETSIIYSYNLDGTLQWRVKKNKTYTDYFWLNSIREENNIIYGFGNLIGNEFSIYSLKIDALNGNIWDTLYPTKNELKLAPNKYAFLKRDDTVPSHIAIINDLNLSQIFELNSDLSLGNSLLITNEFSNRITEFKIEAEHYVIRGQMNYVWDKNFILKTSFPEIFSDLFYSGGNNYSLTELEISTVFISKLNDTYTIEFGGRNRANYGAAGSTKGFYFYNRELFVNPVNKTSILGDDTLFTQNRIYHFFLENADSVKANSISDIKWSNNKKYYGLPITYEYNKYIIQYPTKPVVDSFVLCANKYFVGTTPLNACKKIYLNFKEDIKVSTEETKDGENLVKLLNNPSNGVYTLIWNPKRGTCLIKVYSADGKPLLNYDSVKENPLEIDLYNYSSGIYYIRFEQDGQFQLLKAVKE